jgi:hypothetical protein
MRRCEALVADANAAASTAAVPAYHWAQHTCAAHKQYISAPSQTVSHDALPPVLTHVQAQAKSWLGRGLFVATAVAISWRFASSSIGRFASAFFDHRRRK